MALETLDYDHTLFESRTKGDEKLYVRFYADIVPDPDATAQTGIRKFRDTVMIQIMVPGDKRNIVVREAREDDKERFAAAFKKFEDGNADVLDGFPLSQWPMASRAMVEELKYLGFHTVEHVARAADIACAKHPGLRELKSRAAAWLQAQQDAAPIEKLNSALESRDKEIEALKAQMAQMADAMAKLKK